MPWRLVDQPTSALRRRLVLILAVLTSLLAAAGTFAGVYSVIRLNHQQQDIKDAVDQIQKSRIVLSKQSCRQRNNERAVTRANLQQSKAQLARISDAALAQLGFTRKQAEAQVNKQLRQVAPLDCKKLVRQVAGGKSGKVEGGGSGASAAPRPQTTRGASKVQTGPDGSSGAPKPQSPPERPGGGAKPPSNGGGAGPPSNPPSSGDGGGVVNRKQGVVDHVKQTVKKVAPSDRVGQLFDPVQKVAPPLP
jgi:uncharacterized protein YjiS (DUF1127 family)